MAKISESTSEKGCEYGEKAIQLIQEYLSQNEDQAAIEILDQIREETATKYYKQKTYKELHNKAVKIQEDRIKEFEKNKNLNYLKIAEAYNNIANIYMNHLNDNELTRKALQSSIDIVKASKKEIKPDTEEQEIISKCQKLIEIIDKYNNKK